MSQMEWIKSALGFGKNVLSDLSSDEDTDEDYFDVKTQHRETTSASNNIMPRSVENIPTSSSTIDNANEGGSVETQTDAVLRYRYATPTEKAIINLDSVKQIEKLLDEYEIVSLVYLLYDNAHIALQELWIYLQNSNKEPIYSWASSENSRGNQKWQLTLVEALCIIQNYEVLKSLGYNKIELTTRFLPRVSSTVINISAFRKALFIICDNMNKQDTACFLNHVENAIPQSNLPFGQLKEVYLEIYFLYWETVGFVSPKSVDNVKRIFKVMEKESFYDILSSISITPRQELHKEDDSLGFSNEEPPYFKAYSPLKLRKLSTSRDTHLRNDPGTPGTSFSLENPYLPSLNVGRDNNIANVDLAGSSNPRYAIDPNNPGIVLIINQEDFYTETDQRLKHLLPPTNTEFKLDERTGTIKDEERLRLLFTKFGFTVLVENNLHHEDMVKKITEVTGLVTNESSLFVIILSHGDQGVVYGANSCKVDVSEIQKIMCKTNKNLIGRPKVLLLQSCQGTECQRIEEESVELSDFDKDVTTDGPKAGNRLSVPDSTDFLTFWATVPGYAAIRNKNTGSWFIQAFCDMVEENCHRNHLLDICTRVVNQVASRTWKEKNQINAMTPLINCTFRVGFYFPIIKTDRDFISENFF